MGDDMQRLFALQEAQCRVEELEKAAEESEEYCRKLQLEDVALTKRDALATREKKYKTTRRVLRSLEAELARIESEIARDEAQLFSNDVGKHPKELASLHQSVEQAKKRKAELEESVLEAMDRVESLEKSMALARKSIEACQKDLDEATRTWHVFETNRIGELHRLAGEIASLRHGIDPALLKLFDALRRGIARPVAKVANRACGGCRVALPTSAKAESTRCCPHCDRLLWWDCPSDPHLSPH